MEMKGMKIRLAPCCMCPAAHMNFTANVCDRNSEYLGKKVGECDFVLAYLDLDKSVIQVEQIKNDQELFVATWRSCNGEDPQEKHLPRRMNFASAQEDLNNYAAERNLQIYGRENE